MNHQTRKITEGAMMCAIVGLILFVNRQFGNMLEYFMYWVLTFPILVYTAKYGVRNALVPSVSMLLLSFMISAPTTIFYLFSCIVVGLVYGGGVRKGWKNGTLLVFSGIFTFFSYLVTTILFAAVFLSLIHIFSFSWTITFSSVAFPSLSDDENVTYLDDSPYSLFFA